MLTLLLCGQGQNGLSISALISSFQTRVAADGGVFEAQSCLTTFLTNLNNI
jgi:hypothetical protein